jgi:hypothetical protein
MLSINSVRVDTQGWKLVYQSPESMAWENERSEYLAIDYFSIPPDIPCALDEIDVLRHVYRNGLASVGAGLISTDVETTKIGQRAVSFIKVVTKTPMQPSGMSYLGSLTFPFAEFSYVIKIDCAEVGVTGLRDSIIAGKFRTSGELQIDPDSGAMLGWFQDPYEPTFKGPILKNQSEDEKYDKDFPDHPLSRVRAGLLHLLKTLQMDDAVLKSKPFGMGP